MGSRERDDVLFTDRNLGHAGTMAKDMMGLVMLNELYGPRPSDVRLRWNRQDTARLVREVDVLNAGYN